MKEVIWTGTPPETCDLCDGKIESIFYNARTRCRIWAILCEPCFQDHGVGLGTGHGQRYVRREDGSFAKTAG